LKSFLKSKKNLLKLQSETSTNFNFKIITLFVLAKIK